MNLKLKFLLISLLFIEGLNSKFRHRFTKLKCGSSYESVSNVSCFLKSYRRNNPLINIQFTLNRKIQNGKVKFLEYTKEIILIAYSSFISQIITRKTQQDMS